MHRFSKGFALSTAALLVVTAACAGDDDAVTEASNVVSSAVTQASDVVADAQDDGEGAIAGLPSGTASMTYGDSRIDGEIVSCSISLDPLSAEFTVQAETAQIDVVSAGGLDVDVTVSGAEEFEGSGTISIADGASATSAQLSVTGTGTPADDTATPQDFTMEVSIGSC